MAGDGPTQDETPRHQDSALDRVLSVGGAAIRLIGDGVDEIFHRLSYVVADVEKAFRQGLDPNIEDAKILKEQSRDDPEDREEPPGDAS